MADDQEKTEVLFILKKMNTSIFFSLAAMALKKNLERFL
jgi:hypothetical protein